MRPVDGLRALGESVVGIAVFLLVLFVFLMVPALILGTLRDWLGEPTYYVVIIMAVIGFAVYKSVRLDEARNQLASTSALANGLSEDLSSVESGLELYRRKFEETLKELERTKRIARELDLPVHLLFPEKSDVGTE